MPNFFIDYDHNDVPWAEWIAYELEDAKYTVFYREWDIQPGMNEVWSIDDALQSTEVRVIIVLSPNYRQQASAFWTTAFYAHRLLPIKVRQCSVTGLLSNIKPIDLVGLDKAMARVKLLEGVNPERKRPAASPSFPGSTYGQQQPSIWNVPLRNSAFTDRDHALARLYEIFKERHEENAKDTEGVLTHVINGLGGVGKTQVAIEYAHRYKQRYDAVLWIDVSDEQTVLKDLNILTQLLALEGKLNVQISNTSNMETLRLAVKRWLQASGDIRWLLILDNIPNFALINDFIPSGGNGHVLMTARSQAIGTVASSPQYLPEMSLEDGTLLILRRAKKSDPQVPLQDIANADLVKQAQEISRLMGNLPLALDQVGAYIEAGGNLSNYLKYYNDSRRRPKLLEERGEPTMHHPAPVTQTWNDAFTMISEANPKAHSLLLLCSFLHHEAIPEEVIIEGATTLPIFQAFVHNPLLMEAALRELSKYSFLMREGQTQTFSMHPLVQVVLRDSLSEAEQRQWAEFAISAVHTGLRVTEQNLLLLPSHRCPRYFFHVQRCLHTIKNGGIISDESVDLLYLMGTHMHDYARNADTGAIEELNTVVIIQALEDYAALLRALNHVQEAEELDTFANNIRKDG